MIACEIAKQWVVCPDNGLITWPTRMMGDAKVHEVTWRPKKYSSTFHGRDILAPVAARLAAKQSLRGLATRAKDAVSLKVSLSPGSSGEIIHIDSFGNAMTNLRIAKPQATAKVNAKTIPIHESYSDVAIGDALAFVGSANLLEIAVREGSARDKLKLRLGDKVTLQ